MNKVFFFVKIKLVKVEGGHNMTNNYINKLSYISSTMVQNKVLNMRRYLLTNLKVNNFLHEIKWIGEVYPFFVV